MNSMGGHNFLLFRGLQWYSCCCNRMKECQESAQKNIQSKRLTVVIPAGWRVRINYLNPLRTAAVIGMFGTAIFFKDPRNVRIQIGRIRVQFQWNSRWNGGNFSWKMLRTLIRWQQFRWPVSRVKRSANRLNRRRWRCHSRGVDFAVKLCSFLIHLRLQWPEESNEWEVRARAKRITGRLLPAARPLKPLAAVRLIGHWPWALKYFQRFSLFPCCLPASGSHLSLLAAIFRVKIVNVQTPSFPRNPLFASIYLKWNKIDSVNWLSSRLTAERRLPSFRKFGRTVPFTRTVWKAKMKSISRSIKAINQSRN